ncbi:hypothetical protein ACFXPV_30305 [Streptomyces sp. NPDC059118]|uniref:hypothetical protein n=1 Tax=unclassified Streptomyces TaxID=2593676 RepID=UPI0036991281
MLTTRTRRPRRRAIRPATTRRTTGRKDWWDASLAIGIGVAAGSVNLGFKLFGLSVEHEETEQTITGNPAYDGKPAYDGTRLWKPFTRCTDVKPVES